MLSLLLTLFQKLSVLNKNLKLSNIIICKEQLKTENEGKHVLPIS